MPLIRRNVGEMSNVRKKNLIIIKSIIIWKWNHLFTKNYFRKKKINYCYGFMPSDFQVINGSMLSENRRSPTSTETFILVVRQYPKLSSYGISREINKPHLKKMTKNRARFWPISPKFRCQFFYFFFILFFLSFYFTSR